MGKFLSLTGRILSPLSKILTKMVVLPIMAVYIKFRGRLAKKSNNAREKIILLFSNRYVIHLFIILIALGVAIGNVSAYESRDDYGKNALIYKIVNLDSLEITEDNSVTVNQTSNPNYIDQNTQLNSNLAINNTGVDNQDQPSNDLNNIDNYIQNDNTLMKPEISGSEANFVLTSGIKEYKVAEKDTLGDIAKKFHLSINTILWANNLTAKSLIKPGQTLRIPPVDGVIHLVARGDSLAKIANEYKVKPEDIAKFNKISDSNSLVAGDTLIIPGGQFIPPTVIAVKPKPTTSKPSSKYPDIENQNVNIDTTPVVSGAGQMSWPNSCRNISQYFKGWRHTGVDIACPWGVPVRAAQSGTVSRVQFGTTGYGHNIILNNGGGIQTLYGHLSKILVEAGQEVEKGEVIGMEGSTGNSTGPHLHFEVRVNGVQVNPLTYIR